MDGKQYIIENYFYKHGKVYNKKTNREVGHKVLPTKNNRGQTYMAMNYRDNGKLRVAFVHRVVWLLNNGDWPKYTIDHIDGDSLNNNIENLRDVTIGENNKNKKMYSKNKTGFKGVREEKGRYRAQITCFSKTYYLGYHDTPEDAARAYDKKAKELLGDKAILNFPEEDT